MSVLNAPIAADPTPVNVKALVESWMPQYVQYLEELVNISSGTGDEEGLKRCRDRITEICKEVLGHPPVFTTIKCVDGIERTHMAIRAVAQPEGQEPHQQNNDVIHLSHYDTVFNELPYKFRQDDQYVYGPGVYDNKGAVLQSIFALRLLQIFAPEEVKKSTVSLILADEEIGYPEGRQFIRDHLPTNRAVLGLEGMEIDGEGQFVKVGRRGLIRGTLKYGRDELSDYTPDVALPCVARCVIKYSGVAAHPGVEFHRGVDANHQALIHVSRIAELSDKDEGIRVTFEEMNGGVVMNQISDNAQIVFTIETDAREKLDRVLSVVNRLDPLVNGVRKDLSYEVLPAGLVDSGSIKRKLQSDAIHQAAIDGEWLKIAQDPPSGITMVIGRIRSYPNTEDAGTLVEITIDGRAFSPRHLKMLESSPETLPDIVPGVSRILSGKLTRNAWAQDAKSEHGFEIARQVHERFGFPNIRARVSSGVADINYVSADKMRLDGMGPSGKGDHGLSEQMLQSDICPSIVRLALASWALIDHKFAQELGSVSTQNHSQNHSLGLSNTLPSLSPSIS